MKTLKYFIVIMLVLLLTGCVFGCKFEEEVDCPKVDGSYLVSLKPEACMIVDGPDAYTAYRPSLKLPSKVTPQCSAPLNPSDGRIINIRFYVSADDFKFTRSFFMKDDAISIFISPKCKSKTSEKPVHVGLDLQMKQRLLSKDVNGKVTYEPAVKITDKILFLKYLGYIDFEPRYPVGDFYYQDVQGQYVLNSSCNEDVCRTRFETDDGYYSVFMVSKGVDPRYIPDYRQKVEMLIKSFYVRP